MIKGVGVDVIEVERLRRSLERCKGFRERIFSSREIELCLRSRDPFPRFAARFAAKEAFFKATGLKIPWNRIEVLNDPTGAPHFSLPEPIAGRLHLSLSHLKESAVAMVVYEIL